jgi:hypothetical protein
MTSLFLFAPSGCGSTFSYSTLSTEGLFTMYKVRLGLLLALCVGVVIGCAKSSQAPAKVSGVVTYKNAPVTGGTIKFYSEEENVAYGCQIESDGTYQITDIPVGELTVTVETEHLNPTKAPPDYGKKGNADYAARVAAEKGMGAPIAAKGEPKEKYVKIPSKYANPKTSPLTVTIEKGRQVKPIELTD